MHDVQPQAAAAIGASGGKERLEDARVQLGRNAFAVVAEGQADVLAFLGHGDDDVASLLGRKSVGQRIHQQIGQHLRKRPRQAVHRQLGRAVDVDLDGGFFQVRAQAEQRREERFLRAEKLALEAPVKLLAPLVVFIFPITFLMLTFVIYMKFLQEGGL